ncbi:hypothetical protein BH11PLA1_BH11PLA1_03770 [soil metagenome]
MGLNADELVLVSIGNSRTRAARCFLAEREGSGVTGLQPPVVMDNGRGAGHVAEGIAELLALSAAVDEGADANEGAALVVASVNTTFSNEVLREVRQRRGEQGVRIFVLGAPGVRSEPNPGGALTLPIPMRLDLEVPITVGVDRVLCALAAQKKGGEAAVVIDAGTAVTVDFVDAFGVFQGGVIAPGMGMMLKALAAGTDALPEVEPTGALEEGVLGKTTRAAMRLGVLNAVRGLVHLQIDRCAEMNGAYPRVIATGGDAALLFENDQLVEHIIPDLILMGMQLAWEMTVE